MPPLGEPTANGHCDSIPSIELRAFTVADVLAPIQPEKFLLPGIPAEAYTLIAGALSSYKTTLLVYLLVWKATGFDLLDLDPQGSGVDIGKAVLLTYEDTDMRIFAKLQRVIQHGYHNIESRDGPREASRFVELAAANILRIPLAGKIGMGIVRRFDGGLILPNLSFLEPFYQRLRDVAPDGALIGLDPLRLAIVGSQNDDDGADIAVHVLNAIATAVANSGVIASSHTTKNAAQDAAAAGYASAAYATSGSALYSQHARSNFHLARLKDTDIRDWFDPSEVTAAEAERQSVAKLTHGRLSHGLEQTERYLLMRNGILIPVKRQTAKDPHAMMRAAAVPIFAAIDRLKQSEMRVSGKALEADRALVEAVGTVRELRAAIVLLAENDHITVTGGTRDRDMVITAKGRHFVESRREPTFGGTQ
jgi:RecA-family ATPase